MKPINISWSCEKSDRSLYVTASAGPMGDHKVSIAHPDVEISVSDWYMIVAHLSATILSNYYEV